MTRNHAIARRAPAGTRQAVFVFTTAALSILAVGSNHNGIVIAFSPILSPRAASRTTSNTLHDVSSSSTDHRFRLLAPAATSKPETVDLESLVAAGSIAATETETEKFMIPTPVTVASTMTDAQMKDNNDSGSNSIDIRDGKPGRLQAAVAACFALALAFLPIQDANAAVSGGRMGGSFAAAPRAISRPAPVVRSSGGYSPGFHSRPVVNVAPSFGYGYGSYGYNTPFFAPRPPVFFGGGPLAVSRGPGLFELLFLGVFLAKATEVISETTSVIGTKASSFQESLGNSWGTRSITPESELGPGTSVVQLSVALEVSDRDDPRKSILMALDNLSRTASTDSRVGIQNLSSQVALEILRRSSSIVSASSFSKHYSSREKALREFQNRSINERSKFETETVSKFGGVDYNKNRKGGSNHNNSDNATMAVVTLVLAIDGDSTVLNKINRASDVKQALQKIAADSKVGDCLQSAEILWTPEDRSETLGIRDVIADYPELRSI